MIELRQDFRSNSFLARERQALAGLAINDFEPPIARINQPAFFHAVAAIPRQLERPVAVLGARRGDFHHEVGRSPDAIGNDVHAAG